MGGKLVMVVMNVPQSSNRQELTSYDLWLLVWSQRVALFLCEFQNTWHSTTANRDGHGVSNATVVFKGWSADVSLQNQYLTRRPGIAAYVQVILAENNHPGLGGLDSDYYFYINGTCAGTSSRAAPTTNRDGLKYNFGVLSRPQLPWGTHELTINVGLPGESETLMLLDSVIYTRVPLPYSSTQTAT